MSEEKTEQSFQVSQPAKLNISNICGSVEIRPGEDGIIQVTAIKRTHTGDEKRTEVVITQEADGTVKAATRFPDGSWNWLFGSHPCDVDYSVKAPRQCSLKLNGVSSTTSAEGFEGSCDVNSVSGDVMLRDLTGAIRIHIISGDADGERISGSLDLDTVSGDLAMKDSNLSSIKANTVSGTLQIHTLLTEGPYNFKSISGNVDLKIPPETRFTAELHSISGDLISAFPITDHSRKHGTQTINIQGGGVNVSLKSVSGNLTLESDGQIPPAPAAEGTVSAADRRDVLERIERGEITVEEGLDKLKR
jgi:hypothetical protein